jgi:hypothetical protein
MNVIGKMKWLLAAGILGIAAPAAADPGHRGDHRGDGQGWVADDGGWQGRQDGWQGQQDGWQGGWSDDGWDGRGDDGWRDDRGDHWKDKKLRREGRRLIRQGEGLVSDAQMMKARGFQSGRWHIVRKAERLERRGHALIAEGRALLQRARWN